jgi:hypothetical protein
MVGLTILSSLYLGQHFPAGIIGGLGVGMVILLLAAILVNRLNWRRLFLQETYSPGRIAGSALLLAVGFLLPIGLLFTGQGDGGRIAALLAVNMALVILIWMQVTLDSGALWQRVLRVMIGFGLYFAVAEAVKWISLPPDSQTLAVIKGFVPVFILFVAAPGLVSLTMRQSTTNL